MVRPAAQLEHNHTSPPFASARLFKDAFVSFVKREECRERNRQTGHWILAQACPLTSSGLALNIVIPFSSITPSVPNFQETRRKHEGRDTTKLLEPRQGELGSRGWTRTKNFPVSKFVPHSPNHIDLRRPTNDEQCLLIKKCRARKEALLSGVIRVSEHRQARNCLIKMVQSSHFAQELHQVNASVLDAKRSSLRKLSPVLIGGILCVGGRLITALIIRRLHEVEGHCGTGQVLDSTRLRYWIINGTGAVKRVIGVCSLCRRRSAQIGTQMMAPLPADRVGVGWGPFECSVWKWQATCRRSVGRRGKSTDIYSDNGRNFVGALTEFWDDTKRWSQRHQYLDIIAKKSFSCNTLPVLPEGTTRTGILPGCPSLDRGSREVEVGLEARIVNSVSKFAI
ncbi:hypothetical protein T265_08553 [Opisthorchis viverrini]|uniref:Integrase zinc-binding domain-containing protein n=1 Tax=Opisthorchis viverrini TaxID=6198 RepID=A0A074Z8V1_OPIVI|nr:hypothetical protein T265_08553 [Opisthorchis viverrini]KER23558.1 hypothetical protein T265_08553 [Opisthorchis viverrini]